MDQRIGRLERLVDVLTERMDTVDEWVSESKVFHRDMNTFRDTFVATQAAVRDEQRRRHIENSSKLNMIAVIASLALLVVTALGVYVAYKESQHARSVISDSPTVANSDDAVIPPPTYVPSERR